MTTPSDQTRPPSYDQAVLMQDMQRIQTGRRQQQQPIHQLPTKTYPEHQYFTMTNNNYPPPQQQQTYPTPQQQQT